MTPLVPRPDGDRLEDFLDAALPAVLLVATSAWLPASILLLGYAVRVIRLWLAGDTCLPALTDVPSLARSGLSAAVVLVLYQIPGLLVALVVVSVAVDGPLFGDLVHPSVTDPTLFVEYYLHAATATTVVGFVVAGLALFAVNYLATAALVTFAVTDSLDTALNSEDVRAVARAPGFAFRFLGASLVGVVGHSVAGLLGAVPVVGPSVRAVLTLFVLVVALRLLAEGYPGSPRRPSHESPTVTATGTESETLA